MITFSHRFNLLAKLIALAAGAVIMLCAVVVLEKTPYGPVRIGNNPSLRPIAPIYWLVVGFVGLYASGRFLYRPYLVPAANWLFLALERKTRIPWNDCVRLSPLFARNQDSTWYDADELREIPEAERLDYLYSVAMSSGRLKAPANSVEVAQDYRREVDPPAVTTPKREDNQLRRELMSERGFGSIATFVGVFLSFFSVVSPLRSAAQHEAIVRTNLAAVMATSVFLCIGIAHLILGEKSTMLLGIRGSQRIKPLGRALLFVSASAGVLFFRCMQAYLKAHGYGG
jgi:hypothetical protein